eukprot:gb/GECG01000875.1/.p1 GENE.gb/GECG01000875.1/~~gb/GECG01000875.1/.p1  ORF type:complete len:546 (+),score=65.82 gb/GECG01000875.1/:1-1638(+)
MEPYYAMEQEHPYGVQPLGNAYNADTDALNSRASGLGPLLHHAFSDLQLLEFLEYLDGPDLARLSRCSQVLYAFCHHNDLWKQLFFKEWDDTDFEFVDCWKVSYIRKRITKRAKQQGKDRRIPLDSIRHTRIKVRNVFSDILYQPFLCATMPIQEEWLNNGEDIPRVSAKTLTVEEFRTRFEIPNRPVIITDLVTQWPAYRKWNRSYFLKHYSETIFSCGHFNLPLKKYFEYSDATEKGADDQPLYLFDKLFPRKDRAPGLSQDYTVPEYFSEDLFGVLGTAAGDADPDDVANESIEFRPDYRWLIIGPAKSGSVFHIDPNATSAWNGVLRGSKRWILYPPSYTAPPGVHVSSDGADVATPMAITEWYASFFETHQKMKRKSISDEGPMEATVKEGELLFIPHHWFHQALNLERDTVALTQNYVSSVNLPTVMDFLKDKPDQVSGLPNEEDGQHLYSRFRDRLRQQCPEVFKSLLDRQQDRADAAQKSRERKGIVKSSNWKALVYGDDSVDRHCRPDQAWNGTCDTKKQKTEKNTASSFSFNFNL